MKQYTNSIKPIKSITAVALLVATLALFAGCSQSGTSVRYEISDDCPAAMPMQRIETYHYGQGDKSVDKTCIPIPTTEPSKPPNVYIVHEERKYNDNPLECPSYRPYQVERKVVYSDDTLKTETYCETPPEEFNEPPPSPKYDVDVNVTDINGVSGNIDQSHDNPQIEQ